MTMLILGYSFVQQLAKNTMFYALWAHKTLEYEIQVVFYRVKTILINENFAFYHVHALP